MDRLTATDFYRFLQCPHWPYWERFGDPKDRRPLTADEEKRLNDGLLHERDIITRFYGDSAPVAEDMSEEAAVARTIELMREGAPVIYQGRLADGDWFGKPDLLERQEGKSELGDWYYIPVDVKRSHEMKKAHKAQLMFYSVLLERIQGVFPAHPAIINADGERIAFDAGAFESEFREILQELERIRLGQIPDLVYRKTCEDTAPWGAACRRLAEEKRDIALLYNVDVRRLRSLRRLGIITIDDAAHMNPNDLEGQEPGLTMRGLESAKRQAISLTTQAVIIRDTFVDPTEGVEIHFDIESHPATDVDYLYGIWMNDEYRAFVAERPEDERAMWFEFLDWLKTLPSNYTVYHYAQYEPSRLRILSRRYDTEQDPGLLKFLGSLKDLKEIVADTTVFPLYFYSLKAIGKFLGFHWDGEVKGGGESVVAYEDWLKTGNRATLDAIIQYNRADVRATAHVLAWLRNYARRLISYAQPYPWTEKL